MFKNKTAERLSVIIITAVIISVIPAVSLKAGDTGRGGGQDETSSIAATSNLVHVMEIDSFITPSHFVENQMRIVFIPSYYEVSTLQELPSGDIIKGDDFKCIGAAISFDYTINRDWLFYSIFTAIHAQGKAISRNEDYRIMYVTDGSIKFTGVNAGFGYDLITGDNWSIPFFFGLTASYVKTDIKLTPGSSNLPYWEMTSGAFIPGCAFRIAISRRIFNVFKITPYVNLTQNFTSMKVDAVVTKEGPNDFDDGSRSDYSVGERDRLSVDRIDGPRPDIGINFVYESESSFTFGASISGYLNSYTFNVYNDIFYKSLEYRYMSAFVGFRI